MPIPAMTPHARHESAGDAALLALVDSRGNYADTSIVDATVLVALRHFGFPHRVHDLAAGPLPGNSSPAVPASSSPRPASAPRSRQWKPSSLPPA